MTFPTIPTTGNGRIVAALNTAGGATRTFTNPWAGLTWAAGDRLIAIVIIYDGNSTNAEFSSWSHSFVEFVDQATTATMGIGAASKIASGSESGNVTVATADASATDAVLILMSIPDSHSTSAPEGGTIANGTAAAADPPAVNPSWDSEDTLAIAVAGSGEVSTTGSFTGIASGPTNFINYFETGITADVVGGVEGAVAFRQINDAGGSIDAGPFSVDTSNARNSALLILVRPEPGPTALEQVGFRAYADTGGEGTNPRAAENADWGQPGDTNLRVRFVVDETGGGTGENNLNLQLQYNKNGAGWNDVTGASSVVRSVASSQVTDEGATTRQLTSGSGTFVAGAFDESDGLAGSGNQIDLAAGNLTEVEYVVQIRSADVVLGDKIQLRVIRSGGTLEAWSQTPTVTVTFPHDVRSFNGSTDIIRLSATSLAGSTFETTAVLFKLGVATDFRTLLAFLTSGGTFLHTPMQIDSSDNLTWNGDVFAVIPEDVWILAVVRKATGTANPRLTWWRSDTDQWSAANAADPAGNHAALASTDTVAFATNNSASEAFQGLVAVMAAWANETHWSPDASGDTAIQSAGLHAALANWADETPDSLWRFDQAAVTTTIVDLVGDGDEVARTGTTVVSNDPPPGFDWTLASPGAATWDPSTFTLAVGTWTPVPQPVTVAWPTAVLTLELVAPTPEPGLVTVAWTPAELSLQVGGLAARAEVTWPPAQSTLGVGVWTPAPSAPSVAWAPGDLTLQAGTWTPVPQPVTVAWDPAPLTLTMVAPTPVSQPVVVAWPPAPLTLQAVAPTLEPGPVTVAWTPAPFNLEVGIFSGGAGPVSVAWPPATLTLSVVPPVPTPGPVTVLWVPALLTLQAVAPVVTLGPVTVLWVPGEFTLQAVPLVLPSLVVWDPATFALEVGAIVVVPPGGWVSPPERVLRVRDDRRTVYGRDDTEFRVREEQRSAKVAP